MSAARAAKKARKAPRRAQVPAPERADFKNALAEALTLASTDERIGPLLSATRMRMRFEFPDVELSLNVAAGQRNSNLSWEFDEPAESPQLELEMDSAVANRYLQGRESLAVALARGDARFRGGSKAALLCLPATHLLCEPYRRVITSAHPSLAAA